MQDLWPNFKFEISFLAFLTPAKLYIFLIYIKFPIDCYVISHEYSSFGAQIPFLGLFFAFLHPKI
jgi:hypothetical protein